MHTQRDIFVLNGCSHPGVLWLKNTPSLWTAIVKASVGILKGNFCAVNSWLLFLILHMSRGDLGYVLRLKFKPWDDGVPERQRKRDTVIDRKLRAGGILSSRTGNKQVSICLWILWLSRKVNVSAYIAMVKPKLCSILILGCNLNMPSESECGQEERKQESGGKMRKAIRKQRASLDPWNN